MSLSRSHLRTPLAKVRGLGAARSGTSTWWLERMTSLALLPLSIWFLVGLMSHLGASREAVAAWLERPVPAILLTLLMLVTFLHTKLGIQTIIEDYVHHEGRKIATTILKDVAIYALALFTLFAIVKLHFIGVK